MIGEPPPHIEWRYGAIPLHSDRKVQIDNSDYSTKFSIRPVSRDDSGDYSVTATNSSGRDSVTIQVTVTDKPMPPEGPLQVTDVHKEGCKLKWKRPKDDGGTPIEYYQVDKMDPETGCWVPCGRSTEPSKFYNYFTSYIYNFNHVIERHSFKESFPRSLHFIDRCYTYNF